MGAKEAIAADHELKRAPAPGHLLTTSQSRATVSQTSTLWSQTLSSSMSAPVVGSPPWPSQGLLEPTYGYKWQVEERLGMQLSWGGLGQPHRHHHFHTWQPALAFKRASSLTISNGSPELSDGWKNEPFSE